jgi:hypothetical protein
MCMEQILKDAVYIQLPSNIFCGDADFMLGQVWQPVNNMLKQMRASFSGYQGQAQQSLDCHAVMPVFPSSLIIDMYDTSV